MWPMLRPREFRIVELLARLGIDDRNAAVAAAADGQPRAVGRQGQVARPAAHGDPRLHSQRFQIDHRHFVGRASSAT